jgi:glucosyl-3-phosphoglycerate synthase
MNVAGQVSAWSKRRTYRGDEFSVDELVAAKSRTISLVLPARNVGGTIGEIVEQCVMLQNKGLLDDVIVIDANSTDGTAEIAREQGAIVHQESDLMTEFGAARGKGDAMWRSLSVAHGDIVAFADADTENFGIGFIVGLLGPLLTYDDVALVKGAFRRPFRKGSRVIPDGGGRVTELTARPWINLFKPQLAGFSQPLSGEIAGRRWLFEAIPFPVGYGVEIGMMIDALECVGLDRMAQVDLGTRQNRHQDLRSLSAMAHAVLVAASRRVGHAYPPAAATSLLVPGVEGPEPLTVPTEERPPMKDVWAS